MQNLIQKLKETTIVLEKPGIWSENLKILTSSNYPNVQYFLLKPRTHFQLTNVYKSVFRVFLFCLDLELFAKIKKNWFLHTRFLHFLLIALDLNKIKKNPEHPFVDIVKWETCANIPQKILNSMVVGARQSFQFFRQITRFLWHNKVLP